MNDPNPTRREALKLAAAAAVLGGAALPQVHAGGSEVVQLALIGCGGRGTGAAGNALSVASGQTKLVAMADAFKDRLDASFKNLHGDFAQSMDVPAGRQFIGYDAYRHAMDALRPGDVAILTTPPAFRWPMFKYAIEKGLNVFMEKPIAVDGPSGRKMLALGEEAEKKNLKVGVGLMCRHCVVREELYKRIKDGALGDILLLRAYRLGAPAGSVFSEAKKPNISEVDHQVRRFHSFLWGSGGVYSDFLIHNIDECCWMKDAWPVSATGIGGRHYRGNYVDQNFDNYAVEYTFDDGAKLMLEGQTMVNARNEFASYLHGTKCSAVLSTAAHTPAKSKIYKGHKIARGEPTIWTAPKEEPNPYQLEWDHLIDAIRHDRPYNEVKRGAIASLVTAMGRMACHTGKAVTYEEMLHCDHEFAPDVDKLTSDSTAPLTGDASGRYPVPEPGKKSREY